MKIKAMHGNVVVRADEKPKTVGSIHLPETMKGDNDFVTGVVIDVGPGRTDLLLQNIDGRGQGTLPVYSPCSAKVGERVVCPSYSMRSTMKDSEGRDIFIIQDNLILARIEE